MIDDIQADTGMSGAAASLLVSLPFACLGVFSISGAALIRRFGASSLISLFLLVLAAATAVRAAMPTPFLLILATVPIGVAIAVIGVALPGVVKHHYSATGGTTTGFYASAMNVGAVLAALTVVPTAALVGGWRGAFAITAVPALLGVLIWIRGRTETEAQDHEVAMISAMRPPPSGMLLGVIFGLQASIFAGMVAWIAAVYIEAGWSDGAAALAAAAIPALTVPAALIVNRISTSATRRYWVAWAAFTMALGSILVGLTPTSAPVAWLLILGIGAGAMLPLMLALPLDMRASPTEVTDLTGWMLGLGYVIAAMSPLMIGVLRDATGSFEVPIAGVLAAAGVACGLLVLTLPRVGSPVPRRPALGEGPG